jgi:hypothetical protein
VTFRYECNQCGDVQTNVTLDSFMCDCGGEFKAMDKIYASVFQPFYSRELKAHVTSPKHEDRLLREKGYAYLSDHKSMKLEAAHIRKHKMEYTKAQYASEGVKFDPKKHAGKKFDEKKGDFLKAVAVISLLFVTSTAEAKLPVEYAEITVNGQEIEFPVGNDQRKHEVYYLKKALMGDVQAREVFLGGEDEKWFYIGEGSSRWLRVTKTSENIIEP